MKYALILHGWPQYRIERYFLSNHLRKNGYKVLTPNMFSRKYVFSPANVLNEVLVDLDGKKLDLVVGISLGGLIAPHIVRHFPNAKLIFISSGPRLKSRSKNFNRLLKLARMLLNTGILQLVVMLPKPILTWIYKTANPFAGDKSRRAKYNLDTKKNINFIKSIAIKEEKEILEFVAEVDNTNLLKKIRNKTLIFSGEHDLLMTKESGKMLHQLLNNSRLVINKGSHFDTFTKKDLPIIDKFLK